MLLLFIASIYILIFHKISRITDTSAQGEFHENFSAIITGIEKKRYYLEISAEVEGSASSGSKVVLLYNGESQFNRRDKIFIHKRIYCFNKNNPSASAKRYWLEGVHYSSIISDEDITIIEQAEPDIADRIKQRFSANVDALFQSDTAALVKALYTGNQNFISKDVIIKFREAGILHILSASGLHVAIVAGFPAFLLIFGLSRRFVFTLSLLSVTAYLFMTDMPVSLVRAAVMFFFVYCQMLLFRKSNVFNNLLLAGAVIILLWPWELFSIGFQLSFAATLGIILFYERYIKSMKGLPAYIKSSMALTISAQALTIPLILYHLNQVNTISILSNLIIIPLISIFIYSSFLTMLLSIFNSTLALPGAKITFYIYQGMYLLTGRLSDLDMNFHSDGLNLILITLYMVSLLPLIPINKFLKLRYFPVLFSMLAITLYFKAARLEHSHDIVIMSGKSAIEISGAPDYRLLLDINDYKDADILLKQLTSLDFPVKKIILLNNTNQNMAACRRINSELIIDECHFMLIPSINSSFKNLVHTLEKDNVRILFNFD